MSMLPCAMSIAKNCLPALATLLDMVQLVCSQLYVGNHFWKCSWKQFNWCTLASSFGMLFEFLHSYFSSSSQQLVGACLKVAQLQTMSTQMEDFSVGGSSEVKVEMDSQTGGNDSNCDRTGQGENKSGK